MIIAVRVIVILSLALTAHNRDQDLQCLNKTIAFLKREEILFFPMIGKKRLEYTCLIVRDYSCSS